jgi:hypothetical protein
MVGTPYGANGLRYPVGVVARLAVGNGFDLCVQTAALGEMTLRDTAEFKFEAIGTIGIDFWHDIPP